MSWRRRSRRRSYDEIPTKDEKEVARLETFFKEWPITFKLAGETYCFPVYHIRKRSSYYDEVVLSNGVRVKGSHEHYVFDSSGENPISCELLSAILKEGLENDITESLLKRLTRVENIHQAKVQALGSYMQALTEPIDNYRKACVLAIMFNREMPKDESLADLCVVAKKEQSNYYYYSRGWESDWLAKRLATWMEGFSLKELWDGSFLANYTLKQALQAALVMDRINEADKK